MGRSLWIGLAAALLMLPAPAHARSNIEVVGSSTIFPFTALVIDRFVKTTPFSVVNRSSGTGGGIGAFCAGIGDPHPDIAAASRLMTDDERARCVANGVTDITEIKIGNDGIVIASSARGEPLALSRRHLFDALGKEVAKNGTVVANPHQNWRDIDPRLPDRPIVVLGPPITSGTRDRFVALAMIPGCEQNAVIQALSAERRQHVCRTIRDDGRYVDMGENDIEIVKKLQAELDDIGLFGFSYAVKNKGTLIANPIDGIPPTEDTIGDGRYPLSRPLYLYVKDVHLSVAPGLKEFLVAYTSDLAIGPDGYLSDAGLVALPDAERAMARRAAASIGDATAGR